MPLTFNGKFVLPWSIWNRAFWQLQIAIMRILQVSGYWVLCPLHLPISHNGGIPSCWVDLKSHVLAFFCQHSWESSKFQVLEYKFRGTWFQFLSGLDCLLLVMGKFVYDVCWALSLTYNGEICPWRVDAFCFLLILGRVVFEFQNQSYPITPNGNCVLDVLTGKLTFCCLLIHRNVPCFLVPEVFKGNFSRSSPFFH